MAIAHLIYMLRKILFAFTAIFLISSFTKLHPYHVGSVEFNFSNSTSTFEVTGRFFLDDMENALKNRYGKPVFFHSEKDKKLMEQSLRRYAEEFLKLKADNNFVNLKFIGYEEDAEAVNIYLESPKLQKPKKVEAAVSFLYNIFDDQINIVHIIVDGKRQSHKLAYPDRYLYKSFTP